MPEYTSAASASCGTHFGLTKLVASMLRSPVADRRSISAILSAVAMMVFSFCRPSRGPTSTMRICEGMLCESMLCEGMAMSGLQRHQHGIGLDEVATGRSHLRHGAGARRLQAE